MWQKTEDLWGLDCSWDESYQNRSTWAGFFTISGHLTDKTMNGLMEKVLVAVPD